MNATKLVRICIAFAIAIQIGNTTAKADDRIDWNDSVVHGAQLWEDYFLFNPVLRYYIDSTHVFSDEDVLNGAANPQFKKHEGYTSQIKFPKATYWSRFTMVPSKGDQFRVLEIMTPQTELIWVYFPVGKNEWKKYHTGNLLKWEQRPFAHKNFLFKIPPDLDSTRQVHIKIQSANQVHLLFKIHAIENIFHYSLNEYLYLGIFYGILILLFVYNLLLYINTRSWVYFFYCLSVFTCAGNTLCNDGLGFAYLWPDHPEWTDFLSSVIFSLGFVNFYLLYAYFFLSDQDEKFKPYRKTILYTLIGYLFYSVIRLTFFYGSVDWLYTFPFLITYMVYVVAYFKGFTSARFFIIGSTFAVGAIMIDQMRLHGFIEGGIFTVYSFNIGMVLDSLSLSLALVDRLAQFKRKEKEANKKEISYLKEIGELQNKVTRELESKVKERTTELQEQKDKLESIVNQLQQMSIELDKDNWKLKRTIKEEKEARMNSVEISFEEFLLLYPTPAFCIDRLEEWKWNAGFVCRKCSNDKYSLSSQGKVRKCSRCGTMESITAHTLFHSLKFPLHMAFYMTYRVIQNENCNAEDLSQKTGVSVTSCRAYKKRVLEFRDNVLKKKKLKRIDNWVQLIEEGISAEGSEQQVVVLSR